MRSRNGFFRAPMQVSLSLLLVVGPIYIFEKITNQLYFVGNPAFYTLSGLRLDFFISYCFVAALLLGYLASRWAVGIGSFLGGLVVLIALFYWVCDSRVCYFIGLDYLEPLRLGYFFAAEGVLGTLCGRWLRKREVVTGKLSVVVGLALVHVMGYYPTVFSYAGADFEASLGLFSPSLLIIPISLAAAIMVNKYSGSRKLGALVPMLGAALILLLASGIANQYIGSTLAVLSAVLLLSGCSGILGSMIVRSYGPVISRVFSGSRRHAFTYAFTLALVLLLVADTYAFATGGLVVQGAGQQDQGWFTRDAPSYVGGFMSGDYFGAKGVSVTVDFTGTDPSAIQPDNFLAAGIGVQSPNCCVDGLDYGYRIDVYLFHNGRETVVASAWQTCDVNVACGGRPWRNTMLRVTHDITDPARKLWLAVKWSGRTVNWYYGYDQTALESFAAFRSPRLENPYFNVGELKGIVGNRPTGSAYFFQFGILSKYPIRQGGWSVTIHCPAYLNGDTWACVGHAGSLQGEASYWKVLWRWGTSYDHVALVPHPETSSLTFSYSESTAVSRQELW